MPDCDIVTVRIIGALIMVSVFVALVLDLFVLPALLIRLPGRS